MGVLDMIRAAVSPAKRDPLVERVDAHISATDRRLDEHEARLARLEARRELRRRRNGGTTEAPE